VAYWTLTGRPVFNASTSIAQLVQHVQQAPDPPSRFALHAIPRELDCVVLDCLAKDPADRPRDVTTLARRLTACPVPAWTATRAEAWWRALQPSSST
jgi:serine/threonine-protein kinase